jgi:pimeloyl-[acyl-carrier protein] methyl ester esterase
MFIDVNGSGPPVFLIHGWAMHGGIFSALSVHLTPHFTVHTVDLAGHGRSSGQHLVLEDALLELSTYLAEIHPALLVGWSLGGALATELALRQSTPIRALVSIASSPCFVAKPGWGNAMPESVFTRFAHELGVDWQAVVDRFLALETLGSPNEKSELRWLREQVYLHGKPDSAALESGLTMLKTVDLRARLSCLTVPSLWIGGRRDRIVPPQAIIAAAELSGGRAEILPAAHAPFLAYPEQIAKLIKALGVF